MDREIIKKYYASGVENDRLVTGHSRLEGIRTKEVISRYLNKNGLRILDVGGGAGFYSFWLHDLGHEVTLLDLSHDNVAYVRKVKEENQLDRLSYVVGDATHLPYNDDEYDMVLLLGPMYHLIDRPERLRALSNAKRVLKKGGVVIAAYISRYASMMDGFRRNLIADDQFISILKHDLETGNHKNETDNPEYFTTAYFHLPEEIGDEIRESGLFPEKIISVEGLGWLINDLQKLESDGKRFSIILDMIRKVETSPDLIGASPHLLGIARKN